MFIEQKDKIVVDYQLIYNTDSNIHLDFYADGLASESNNLFGFLSYFKKVNYGFLVANSKSHNLYEQHFSESLKDEQAVESISEDMVMSIRDVHIICRKLEKLNLEVSSSVKPLWENLYRSVTKMLSYKRFSDRVEPFDYSNLTLEEYEDSIKSIKISSHYLKLSLGLARIAENPTKDNIDRFIRLNGFIFDFNIKENQYESESGIASLIQQDKLNSLVRPNDLKIERNKMPLKDKGLILFKRVGWYEETRHYYQLRALRNYRVAFQKSGLNIYETTNDTFLDFIDRG